MLSTSEANAAANAVLEAGKAERIRRLEAAADRIPRIYRSSFLSRVPGWRQAELIREARRTAGSAWVGIALGACLIWLVGVLWFAAERSRLSSAICLAMPAVGGLSALLRVVLVKLKLQQLLLEDLAHMPSDGI